MQDTFNFSPFRLDAGKEQLWRDSEPLHLRPKTFAVLLYLVRNSHRLVSKQELLDTLWSSASGSEELLRRSIYELRQVLGDDPEEPRYIETVPVRGYRFLPNVEPDPSVRPEGEPEQTSLLEKRPPAKIQTTRKAELRVGILHSLSGTMAVTEIPVVDATLLAIEEINQRGGLMGLKIQPVVLDGESDETVFALQAEQLITQEKVATVFGCWTSASRKAVLPIVEKLDHLLVYPTQYEGMEQCANIFYTGAAPNQQIIPAVHWAFGFPKKKRFFLVGWNSVYSRATNAIIRDEVQALGGEIVGEEYLLPNSIEVGNVVSKIVELEPDMIFNSVAGDTNVYYTRLLRVAGVTPGRVPTVYFSVSEIELLNLATKEIVGDYAAWNYFQSIDLPANHAFVKSFRARYGSQRVTADPMEAGYLGVHLWAQAVEAAESVAAPAIRQALPNQSFEAPGGLVRIDPENQHTWKTFRLGKIVEGGQFEVVWSSGKTIRPEPYPSSRSPAEWTEFLADLYEQWGGHWTQF